jgi:hypothetical protein
MPSRRRSRNKSIAGNITDVQKRLRYLETRPAPSQLAKKVVSTKNIALRAVEPDVIADAAVVRRTLAPESVISANLSVVGDPDGAAVATENVQDTSITNEKLAGDIEDDKIVGISASKVGPDQLVDDQLAGISTDKLIGEVTNDQLAGLISFDKIDSVDAATISVGQIEYTQIESVDAATISVGLIVDDQIDGISGEKIIGGIDGDLIVAGSIEGSDGPSGVSKIASDSIGEADLAENSVGFDEIQGLAIDTVHIRENAVTEYEISDLAIQRRHLNDNIIIASKINAGAVQTEKIQNLAVTNGKIANDTIVGSQKIAPGTITSNELGEIGRALYENTLTLGTGLSRSWPVGGSGSFGINLSVSSGANSVAVGNHTHGQNGYTAAGSSGVPSHTHPVSINDTSTSNGSHGGHSTAGGGEATRGSHTHVVGISGNTGTPSTIKLKKEVTDYSMIDVKNLLNLNLKRYKYKNQARHLQEGREWMYGYIAEEVEELGIQEIVGYDKNKEPNAINYGLLSTLVLELVKVQQTEIDSLKEEIQRLKEKI